jgi:hypothetical protein
LADLNLFSRRFLINTVAAGLVLAAAAVVPPAFADVCDQPPFGSKNAQIVEDFMAIGLSRAGVHEMLRNICLAKFMHDPRIRKAMHEVGFSDELIDRSDVGGIAARALQEFIRCKRVHNGDASGC